MKILFFDTETTGLPKNWAAPIEQLDNWPRLVQIAWQIYDENQRLIESFDFIVKPNGFSIPIEASDVHKITTEKAEKVGVDLNIVLRLFYDSVSKSNLIVAHNYSYDYSIMGSEFLRNGYENILEKKESICTMESSTDYCKIQGPNGYKWPKLEELYGILFNQTFNAHDALDDVIATARCFWELKKKNIISYNINKIGFLDWAINSTSVEVNLFQNGKKQTLKEDWDWELNDLRVKILAPRYKNKLIRSWAFPERYLDLIFTNGSWIANLYLEYQYKGRSDFASDIWYHYNMGYFEDISITLPNGEEIINPTDTNLSSTNEELIIKYLKSIDDYPKDKLGFNNYIRQIIIDLTCYRLFNNSNFIIPDENDYVEVCFKNKNISIVNTLVINFKHSFKITGGELTFHEGTSGFDRLNSISLFNYIQSIRLPFELFLDSRIQEEIIVDIIKKYKENINSHKSINVLDREKILQEYKQSRLKQFIKISSFLIEVKDLYQQNKEEVYEKFPEVNRIFSGDPALSDIIDSVQAIDFVIDFGIDKFINFNLEYLSSKWSESPKWITLEIKCFIESQMKIEKFSIEL